MHKLITFIVFASTFICSTISAYCQSLSESVVNKEPIDTVMSAANSKSILSQELKLLLDKETLDTSDYDIEIHLKDTQAEHYEAVQHTVTLQEMGSNFRLTLNGKDVSEADLKAFTENMASDRRVGRRVHLARQNEVVENFIVRWMKATGRTVKPSANGLMIRVKMKPSEIKQLHNLYPNDIRYIQTKLQRFPAINTAKQATNVTTFAHGYGFKGAGVGIWKGGNFPNATTALSGKVTNLNINTQQYTADADYSADDHTHETLAAETLVSNNPSYLGFAPDAYVYAASGESPAYTSNYVLDLQSPPVFISSNSWDFASNPNYTNEDRYWDDYVFNHRITSVFSAGNSATEVFHPAAAFNVISVGAFNQLTTPYQMQSYSSYANPNSPASDRQKPEVVAPSESIQLPDGVFCCTSSAAPMVAGMAADLASCQRECKGVPVSGIEKCTILWERMFQSGEAEIVESPPFWVSCLAKA